MKRDYIVTFATEFFAMACGILVFRLAAVLLGEAGFGEYMVARRTISFLQLPLMLGMGISVPRYIAFREKNDDDLRKPDAYFVWGLALVTALMVAVLIVFAVFSKWLAFVFFGDGEYAGLMVPLGLALAGICIHCIVYGYFRGHLRMIRANVLQAWNTGIVPLIGFASVRFGVRGVLFTVGILWLLTDVLVVAMLIYRNNMLKNVRGMSREVVKELLKYGLPRVPGEAALTGLMALPVFLTTHLHGVTIAGHMAFAVSLLSMTGSVFAPLGLILLPRVSRLTAESRLGDFRHELSRMLTVCLALACVIVVGGELLAAPFVKLFLGEEFAGAAGVIRVILIGAVPYVVYIVLRNVLDGARVKPVNTINLCISLAVFAGLVFLVPGYRVAVALTVGLTVLGVLSFVETLKLLRASPVF